MSKVAFGDVVREVKLKIDRDNNPYEFYVAGDHMDTEDLKIRRRGRFATDDVGPAFIREFHVGQILYGSRRTYLKKIAVADFDGVTANTTFVLESKDESVLLQRLIPFIMLSEGFTKWSIMKSKGSTNPYVLFSDIAAYEFKLPTMAEQKKLTEVLWGINDTMEAYKKLLSATDELLKSQFIEMFGDIDRANYVKMEDVCMLITDGTHQPPKSEKDGIPFLFVSNITSNELSYDAEKFISEATYRELIKRTPIETGDILLSTVGSYGHAAIVKSDRKFCFQRHIAFLKPDRDKIRSGFLHAVILSNDIQRQIEVKVRGVAQKTLNLSEIKTLVLPLPDLQRQDTFLELVEQTDKSKFELERALAAAKATYKSIIAENLG